MLIWERCYLYGFFSWQGLSCSSGFSWTASYRGQIAQTFPRLCWMHSNMSSRQRTPSLSRSALLEYSIITVILYDHAWFVTGTNKAVDIYFDCFRVERHRGNFVVSLKIIFCQPKPPFFKGQASPLTFEYIVPYCGISSDHTCFGWYLN